MKYSLRNLVVISAVLLLLTPLVSISSNSQNPATMRYHVADTSDFVRGPTVNMVTNNSALIFWRTVDLADSLVEYGLSDSDLNMTVNNSTDDTDHRIQLTGLNIDTTYYYRVGSDGIFSDIYHFKTAPADGANFKMIIVGDNRPDSSNAPIQPEVFEEIVARIITEEPHIVVMTGDYVYQVTSDDVQNRIDWEYFTNITDRMGHYAPIYAVIGNHDTGERTGATIPQYFLDAFEQYGEPSLYRSFDYAGVHFTLLDSEIRGFNGQIIDDQYDWLVNDLSTTTMSMKFVFLHRPFYPLAHLGSALDVVPEARDQLQILFEEQNVTLVGAGHDHVYNRITVNGVVHIIAGGGGAPVNQNPWGGAYNHFVRADVQSNQINFATVEPDGSIVDGYQFPDTGPIEIQVRTHANNTQKAPDTILEIYFSQVPATKYFSWDGEANSSILTGVPNAFGEHTLDVYAEDDEGVWSHVLFVYSSTGGDTTTTTTDTTPVPTVPDNTLLFLMVGVGAIAIVVVIILVRFKQR